MSGGYDWQRGLDLTDQRIAKLTRDLETEHTIRAALVAAIEAEAVGGNEHAAISKAFADSDGPAIARHLATGRAEI